MRTITFKNPVERANRISQAKKGMVFSKEHRQKLSEARKRFYTLGGIHPKGMLGKHVSSSRLKSMREVSKGEKSHLWKGQSVSYSALHSWVRRWLGKPNKCESCGKVAYGREMHWANTNHKYERNLTDWLRLCRKCHLEYDRNLAVAT